MVDPDLRERVIEAMRSIRADSASVGIIQGAVAAEGRQATQEEIRDQCDELVKEEILTVKSAEDDREYRLVGND